MNTSAPDSVSSTHLLVVSSPAPLQVEAPPVPVVGEVQWSNELASYAQEAGYEARLFSLSVEQGAEPELQQQLREWGAAQDVDVAVLPVAQAPTAPGLICLDCDSTLITGEVIEMLAAFADREAEVAEVTERAMRGELDFEQSLRERVATLAGLSESVIAEVAAALELTAGVEGALRFMQSQGVAVAVVSGGFIQVLEPLAAKLNLDYVRANTLEITDGLLSGRVVSKVVDRAAKEEFLREFAADRGVEMSQTIAVGDGANDIDMINAAGIGVAFCAKPALRDVADVAINQPSLAALPFLAFAGAHYSNYSNYSNYTD